MADHDIFISYARADNRAGQVTAFRDALKARHRLYRGRELKIFFDTDSIDNGADWERRIRSALRSSKLFLALLSPNALNSEWCRREWEEYLRLEHTLARGDDGIETLFLAEIPGLLDGAPDSFGEAKRAWIDDIRRRHHDRAFDLRAWPEADPPQLGLIDADDRLAELRAHPPQDSGGGLVKLADQIAAIDRAIAKRLDRATLAEFAPGGHLPNPYRNFVGRAKEMRDLHRALAADKVGVVGALHGLGGQGKTALAVQYAHAYAELYAAGGRWLLNCEKKKELFSALAPLAALLDIEEPRPVAGESEAAYEARFLSALIEAIERRMAEVAPKLAQWLASSPRAHARPEDQPEVERAALLILENVDNLSLLSATQMAWLAERPWLHVIVTTRLDPTQFGGLVGALAPIAVDDLPPDDAFALLGRLRPIVGAREAEAAREIVRRLGGFTLGIELVGAYLGASPSITYAGFRDRLGAEGLTAVDTAGADVSTANRLRYERQKQIGAILAETLAGLSDAARETLAFAAMFPPDSIPEDWLRFVVASARPELAATQVKPGYPDPWAALLADLAGRRLLPKGAATEGDMELLRMHRLVGEYVLGREPPERVEARWAEMLKFVDALGRHIDRNWPRAPHELLSWIAPFAALAEHVHRARAGAVTARAISVLADCELQLGRFLHAGELREASLATVRRLSEASPGDARAARDLSVSLERMGDFHLRRGGPGDAERALAAFEESLATARRLSDASPGDAQAARDVSVALNKLGDFHLRRGGPGDADRALAAYEECLDIARRLSEASPDDAQAARDLSVSLERIGDFHLRRGGPGDADRALAAFEEDLRIARRLSEASPGDARAARDVSVSLERIGDFHLRRGGPGDADRALAVFEESLATRRRLGEASPGDARAARDVSASLNRIGDFHLRRGGPGDAERALAAFEESLAIRRRLSEASPGDAEAARDVSVSLDKMGDFHLRRGGPGDAERALAAFEESLAIRRRLSEASPGDAEAARDVSVSLERLGDFYLRLGGPGDAESALAALEESLAIRRRLSEASPGDARAARDLFGSHFNIARLHASLGDAEAERAAGEAAFAILEDFVRNGRMMDEQMRQTHAWLKQKLRAPRVAGSGGKTALLPRLLAGFRTARRHLGIF